MTPTHAQLEAALDAFRTSRVDLGAQVTKYGRTVRDDVIVALERLSGQHGLPLVWHGASFGAGSFGRRTASQPLNDIDIYLVFDAGALTLTNLPSWTLKGSGYGTLGSDPLLQSGAYVSPAAVLARLAGLLPLLRPDGQVPDATGVNKKGKSVYLKLLGGALNVDITPTVWATCPGMLDRYYMPQGNGAALWKPTNPKEDQRRITGINQRKRQLVLPTVRMLKWWNDAANQSRLKGIHLEVLAEQAFEAYDPFTLSQALHVCFVYAADAVLRPCADPTAMGDALDANLSLTDRSASYAALQTAANRTDRAGNLVQLGLIAAAITEWGSVFPGL